MIDLLVELNAMADQFDACEDITGIFAAGAKVLRTEGPKLMVAILSAAIPSASGAVDELEYYESRPNETP